MWKNVCVVEENGTEDDGSESGGVTYSLVVAQPSHVSAAPFAVLPSVAAVTMECTGQVPSQRNALQQESLQNPL